MDEFYCLNIRGNTPAPKSMSAIDSSERTNCSTKIAERSDTIPVMRGEIEFGSIFMKKIKSYIGRCRGVALNLL